MKKEKITEQLTSILPNRVMPSSMNTAELVEQEAANIKHKLAAKELARIKKLEMQKLRRLEDKQQKRQALAEELGVEEIPDGQTELQAIRLTEQKKRVEAVEAIESQTVEPLNATELAEITKRGTYQSTVNKALMLQGPSRPEMAKLLTSLNINLSVQLTKQDTANLLACLLTCNSSQLQALMSNKRVPVVIKTVIRRLIEDEKFGNTETIEKLWDRIFGKGPMQLDLPEQQQLQTGIIPNVPISREAYVVIRDTLIK